MTKKRELYLAIAAFLICSIVGYRAAAHLHLFYLVDGLDVWADYILYLFAHPMSTVEAYGDPPNQRLTLGHVLALIAIVPTLFRVWYLSYMTGKEKENRRGE